MNLNPDETNENFVEGVRYALDYLRDVFGEEITETDIWQEYYPEED